MVGTPGPANMLLMTAGATHGFVKLIPFLVGLVLGKLAMNLAGAFGLVGLSSYILTFYGYWPLYLQVYDYACPAGVDTEKCGPHDTKAYSLWLGLMVHPLSPKSWMMVTLSITQFSGDFTTSFEKYALIPLSFIILQSAFHSLWCMAGALLQRRLTRNLWLHRGLIILTILVIVWALLH